jgi:hypothetical protein
VFLHVEADASGPDPLLRVKLVRGDETVIHRKKYQLSDLVAKKKDSTGQ